MITNHPLHHHPMTPIKNENADFLTLERNRLKVNQKTLHNSLSSKSLTTEKESSFNNLAEHNKFFSNSLNCLI